MLSPRIKEDVIFGPTLARSLSAVSEAPLSEELGVETLCRGASDTATCRKPPRGLWDLHLDEPILILCEYAIAVRALGFQLRVTERMVMGWCIGECGARDHTTF
jgi:hypothetical protein